MEFENMTDKQFDVLMNSIIQIVKDSETKDEAVEKLQNLVKGKENKRKVFRTAENAEESIIQN